MIQDENKENRDGDKTDMEKMDLNKINTGELTADELLRQLPKGFIMWHSFDPGQCALCITGDAQIDQALAEAVGESGMPVDIAAADKLEQICDKKYDYVIIASAMEQTKDMREGVHLLQKASLVLKRTGRMFLGLNNRLGIRYFCGDKDPYTGRNFDGIEDYVRAYLYESDHMKGRCYAKAEIRAMLEAAGMSEIQFYSVFPCLERPQILFADDYMPNEQLDIRIFPQYNCAETVFLEEELLYGSLLENGMFHAMANAFWIEAGSVGSLPAVNQITMSMDRGRENAMFTIIRKDNRVEKRPVYVEGKSKLNALMSNTAYLKEHGIHVVEMTIENDACVMSYIHAQSTLEYLRGLLLQDKDAFLKEMDRLWQLILHSSEQVPYDDIDWDRFEPGWENMAKDDPLKNQWKEFALNTPHGPESIGPILKRGYIDLIPLNSFHMDGEYIFYDQEMYVENLPAKVILSRTVDTVYLGNWHLSSILSIEELRERYGLIRCGQLFNKFAGRFLARLRNDRILRPYHKEVRRKTEMLSSNRLRMNYSAVEYDRLFRDIFRGAAGRNLYLFGTGEFAKLFLSQFGKDCNIAGMIDNDRDKWGKELGGVPIYSPEILKDQIPGTYKIIICIKNHMAVMEQLRGMGIDNFSIYDPNLTYARPASMTLVNDSREETEKKKYNVGYIAGVFDLFHIGHLNLLKRAKEQCNYLIVGVVTDEGVIQKKHSNPFIPFIERIEIVRSCKYVDEAVEIPLEYYDTDEAYRRYQFDVQFSGSDYADSKGWLAKKEYLQKNGSDLVFFPYTQSVSSTRLKELISKKLL